MVLLISVSDHSQHARYDDFELLLGDLHSHWGESRFLGSLPEGVGADEPAGSSMFRYARDIASLNFFCLSEHDWQMDELDWTHIRSLNDEYLNDSFVTGPWFRVDLPGLRTPQCLLR